MLLCRTRDGAKNINFESAAAVNERAPRKGQNQLVGSAETYHGDTSGLSRTDVHSSNADDRQGTSGYFSQQGSQSEKLLRGLSQTIIQFGSSPISEACFVRGYQDTPYWKYMKGDPIYEKACLIAQNIFKHYTTAQFIEFHNDSKAVFDIAKFEENLYYDVHKSTEVLHRLLLHQYGTHDRVKDFLQTCLDIFDKIIPKCNTILVVGPPNSGKNFFFDCVTQFYVCVGVMSNPSKYNQFPFNQCYNKRVLIWNEPSCPPEFYETLKKVTAGDPESINVKHKNACYLSKTPLFITSNHNFLQYAEFKDRVRRYNWRTCDDLKTCTKYPSPLAWAELIKKYELKIVKQ